MPVQNKTRQAGLMNALRRKKQIRKIFNDVNERIAKTN
jgi:hypothetical protein